MILVSGGTGFIGRALIRHLIEDGKEVRLLIRPSAKPRLPTGIPLELTVSSLTDERGLAAAMRGVETVYHLAGAERAGIRADLNTVDVEGTQLMVQTALRAGVSRFFYLSHLGADRSSAYPLLKAKGLAENIITGSGIPYTIFRTAPVTGPGDQFTEPLKRLIQMSPFIFLNPDGGGTRLQPIWIEDLITCLTLALDDPKTVNRLFQVGGEEYLTFTEIVKMILEKVGWRRTFVSFPSAYLRILGLWVEQFTSNFPFPLFWIDYLAVDRICSLDTVPHYFGLIPARFSRNLDYLRKG